MTEKITLAENTEYLKKIKPEYIEYMCSVRDDTFYDRIDSFWELHIHLNVRGQESEVVVTDFSPWYKKIIKMVEDSNEFTYRSVDDISKEMGYRYGKFDYTRKK